jgi:hypothetical protein
MMSVCLATPWRARGRVKFAIAFVRCLLNSAVGCVLILVPSQSQAQADLEYQDRGNRFEGIRSSPVSGYDIELVSSVIDYGERLDRMPDTLNLRFFANRAEEISVTVREIDNRHFYWLDRVRPETPWASGRPNTFGWDTTRVLQRIAPPLDVADLGVLVRVGRPQPSADERVLPVAIFATAEPTKVNGYMFAFKPCCDTNVSCSLHAEGSEKVLATQIFRRTPGSRPFTCRVDAAALAPGSYRLVLVGYLTGTNQRVRQVVRFTHRPNLR